MTMENEDKRNDERCYFCGCCDWGINFRAKYLVCLCCGMIYDLELVDYVKKKKP